jgi:hypothetical protein
VTALQLLPARQRAALILREVLGYLRAPSGGISDGTGLFVLTLTGDRICALARFENSVLPWVRATAIASCLMAASVATPAKAIARQVNYLVHRLSG